MFKVGDIVVCTVISPFDGVNGVVGEISRVFADGNVLTDFGMYTFYASSDMIAHVTVQLELDFKD